MTEVMLGKPKHIRVNSFFVMRKFIKDGIIKYANNYPYMYGIIFALTKNVANVEVEHRARTNGKSNYTLKKLLGLWMNGFLNYSVAIALVTERLIFPPRALGWTSLMVVILFFSGVQLLSIGLVGEYIGRLFISASGLPRATVKETVNIDSEESQNG